MKPTKKHTQNQRLLAYLKKNPKGITTMEAFANLGICRLSERIREIDHAAQSWVEKGIPWHVGCKIIRITRTREKTASGSYVTRYKLAR
jgi:hypothetical protein